jgi:hypothetical protein
MVRSDDDVEIAIVVEIAERGAPANFWFGKSRARLGSDVPELSASGIYDPGVQKKMRRLLIRDIASDVSDSVVNVTVHHQQIQKSIQVGIEEEATEAEAAAGDPAYLRHRCPIRIDAFAAPSVEANHFVVEVGDGNPRHPGVLVIGHIYAHAGASFSVVAERDSGFDGHVSKGAIVIVPVEFVGLGIVGDKQIRPAVLVVIQHGDSQ